MATKKLTVELNYLANHATKVKNRLPISPFYLEKGMIAEIYYMKEVDGKKVLGRYICLILHPNWRGKCHALKLNIISPARLLELVKPNGLIYSKRLAKVKRVKFSKMLIDMGSQQFYNQEIKRILGTKLNNAYRTFTLKNIKTAMAFDYTFPSNIPIVNDDEIEVKED
jgi:hypothetical protein